MKMKISNLVEQIFATAVALDQSGGLKNTIYAIENEIYVMNYDHTVLLRFRLRKSEAPFKHPISFKANDYDSNEFEEKDGRVIFHSQANGYERKKTCGTSEYSPEEVRDLYKTYKKAAEDLPVSDLSAGVLPLLDENLSHIEFSGTKKEGILMRQRNIYSGGIVEIKKESGGMFGEKLSKDFGPVAMKTHDFQAMFSFQDTIQFTFPTRDKEDFIFIKSVNDGKRNMSGVIACCLYDELINLKGDQQDGRKKQKIRRRK